MIRAAKTLILVGAAFLGGAITSSGARADDPYAPLAVFARVLGYVEESYVEDIGVERLVQAAIRGLMTELDGPSAYLDPAAFAALRAEARPDFGGVGVVLRARGEEVVVTEIAPDTPAARAGIEPGAILLEVDGWPARGAPLTRVVERITGVPGTTVRLTLEPGGGSPVRVERLVRGRIYERSVTARVYGELGYLRIVRFDPRTLRDLRRGLAQLADERPIGGLVLDLRGNPGGILEQAVDAADLWLKDGKIVTTAGRARPREVAQATERGTEPDYPIAVLVDGGTASAAEILAGALGDRGRARLFGQRSFGKGSVQTLIELEDGSALKLTVARYLTPSGRSIQGRGIEPNVAVEEARDRFRLGDPAYDAALAAALAWLAGESGRLSGLPARAAAERGER